LFVCLVVVVVFFFIALCFYFVDFLLQSALKVDQNDAKIRLTTLEGQMAGLQTKAKVGCSAHNYYVK
jgi:hypothetical protein